MPYSYQQLVSFALFLGCLISDVVAEICDDGSRCTGGKHCCSIGCCYGDDDDDDRRYTYGYRLSIWNMWYFWFVILFLMMSCFGGCGYYKHRQRLVTGQPVRGHRNFLSILTEPYNGGTARVLTVENGGYPENRGYVLSRGPDPNLAASMAPPPYTEVMNNPGLFPPNTKLGVPGGHTHTGSILHNTEPTSQMPQPPPYTEVVNQNEAETHSASQNVQNQSQTSNQVRENTATLQ
ncbi:uncharacterized protein LOC123530692 isoform X2 [Mercenaria mercenaria]|uniref:uncharacterized protein LOC123530692 isoform X2 n=1 Tax=Mercenaria mercenaria TaxID=6596 RepID=UPI001E1D2577|nr:uncharacterized protein LOC123530692 isoform X2 [Mercenaria mercenaria]